MRFAAKVVALAILLTGALVHAQSEDGTDTNPNLFELLPASANHPYLEIGPIESHQTVRYIHINLEMYAEQEPLELRVRGEGVIRLDYNGVSYVLDLKRRTGPPKLTEAVQHPLKKPTG